MADLRARPLRDYLDHLGDEVLALEGPGASGSLEILDAGNDSRRLGPGSIFVAIAGAADDGHRYLDAALAAGARVVVSERRLKLPPGTVLVRVRDAYRAAGFLAEVRHGFPARRLELAGITGTNGKTTTAFLLREILARGSAPDVPVGLVGTVGYDCGAGLHPAARTTPDPFVIQALFARMAANGCRRAVLEVSSHALVQHRLGSSLFRVALFTNLSGDHLDYHGSLEEYFRAKSLLFRRHLAPRGVAVVNGDDAYGCRLYRGLPPRRRLSWSRRRPGGDFRLRRLRQDLSGQVVQLAGPGGGRRLFSPLVGVFNAENLAAAVLAARAFGVDWPTISAAVQGFTGVPGRFEKVPLPGGALALVDYAHTDDALRRVLAALAELPHRRLIVIFGCGGDRDRSKRPRMAAAAARADKVIVTSDNPRGEAPEAIIAEIVVGFPPGCDYEIEPDRRRALARGVALAGPGDLLLVAGKGHEDYQEIAGCRHPFDDRAELRRLGGGGS